MALINTTTTGILGTTVYGDGAGALTVQKDGVTQGVYGNIPAFSVSFASGSATASHNTWTKIPLNTKAFDTNNNFDSTTNYRFTPSIAGYYQFSGTIRVDGVAASSQVQFGFWKNGNISGRGVNHTNASGQVQVTGSALVYMNGTTDYMELQVYLYDNSGANRTITADSSSNFMTGFLAKAV